MEYLNEHFDVLREISNIGAGNAATALAKMLNRRINVGIPHVNFIEFPSIADRLGGPEKVFIGILVNLSEDINGMMMFLLDMDSVNVLIESFLGIKREAENFNLSEMEISLIKELGNILSASYLNSLSSLTNLKIFPSVPYMTVDMANAILSVPAIEFGKLGDSALLIESVLGSEDNIENMDIVGYFILVPDMESFDIILRSLGVK